MFKQEVLDQLTDYTLETWGLDSSQSVEIARRLSYIFLKCYEEYMKRPDRTGKGAYQKIERALAHLKKAEALLLDPYMVSFKDAPFAGILQDEYALLENVGTFSEDELLQPVQLSTAQSFKTLRQWLNQNGPNSSSRANHRRKIIIIGLHALYQKLTGERHIDRNHPDLAYVGERIHTPFSKVALLIDRLIGNPHKDIAPIPEWKGSELNINDIVNCSPTAISSFCKDIQNHI
jgi:hypothetical protein